MQLLREPQLVRAARVAADRLAGQVLRLERDLRVRSDIVAQARVESAERREVDWVAAPAAVELGQKLAAPVVRKTRRDPVIFIDPGYVEAVAEPEQRERVGGWVRTALEAHVAKHLGQRSRDAEARAAEEVLTLKLQPVNIGGLGVDRRRDREGQQRIVRAGEDVLRRQDLVDEGLIQRARA